MTACPTLITERLILRPLEETDLDAYTEMFRQPAVRDSLRLPATYSRVDAWNGMVKWRGQWELRGSGHWAVEERSTGRLVGSVGLNRPESPDWPGLEVGWTLHPGSWGQGYATEGGASSIDYAFEVIGVDEVFSVILPSNARSQSVARRLGLTLIEERLLSTFPDSPHGIWRLGRDRWQPVTPGVARSTDPLS